MSDDPATTPPPRTSDTLVIFSQVFVPDPASVGQHMADLAFEMARRGYRVRVYTANAGYENPEQKYPPHEWLNGVEVVRLPFSSFGKKTIPARILGTASFMAQAVLRGLFIPNLAGIIFSTSPPLVGIAATIVKMFRGVPLVYWAMDLNPDQLIALGKVRASGFIARTLEALNRLVLQNSTLIVALDRFMAGRLYPRGRLRDKLVVIPPWPHEDVIEPLSHEDNPFRKAQGLDGRFVVMYSGNHSPSNPLTTLLDAAVRLKNDASLKFYFVGGGAGKREVEKYIAEHNLINVVNLPYQPLETLRYSLSSADVHVVSLGESMVGIIHPCKVYGAMAVGRPVIFFGPRPSHIADLLDRHPFGFPVRHGDIDAAVAAIKALKEMPAADRESLGRLGQQVLKGSLSQDILLAKFCDGMELVFSRRAH